MSKFKGVLRIEITFDACDKEEAFQKFQEIIHERLMDDYDLVDCMTVAKQKETKNVKNKNN